MKTASHALLSAALGGLLCALPACSSSDSGNASAGSKHDSGPVADSGNGTDSGNTNDSGGGKDATTDATGDAATDAATDVMADAIAEAGADAEAGTDAAVADAAPPVCDGGPEAGAITSSQVVTDMTLAKFTSQCDARGGTVEQHSHCGGANTCRGMSYDTGTQTLTEHTCKGLNTCAGYSCVIC